MRNQRVYPLYGGAHNIVESVDLELQQISESTDDFIKNLYSTTTDSITSHRITGGYDTNRPISSGPRNEITRPHGGIVLSRSHRELLRKEVSTSNVVPFHDQQGDHPITGPSKSIDIAYDDGNFGDIEEVKLSHELRVNQNEEQEKLIANLRSKFSILQEQVNQYKALYKSSFDKLKETEARMVELESRVEDLDEEKQQLVQQVQSQSAANANNIFAIKPNLNRVINTGGNQMGIQANKEFQKALLFTSESATEDDDGTAAMANYLFNSSKGNFWWKKLHYLQSFLTPFRRDIRQIHARYGSSVASYFTFYRYMFILLMVIGTLMKGFFVWHVINLSKHLQLRDYLQFTGYVPSIMSVSAFSTGEGLLYDLTIILVLIIFLFALTSKLVIEDRLAKDLTAIEAQNRTPYSKDVLAIWDFSVISSQEIVDFQGSMSNKYLQSLEASRLSGLKKSRSQLATCIIYSRRTIGLLLYVVIVGASFAVIIYVTINNTKIANMVKNLNVPVVNKLDALVVPLILNFINGTLPMMLKGITQLEGWDSAETISNIILFRMYLSSILNALLIAFSYLILTDPELLVESPTLRSSLGVELNLTEFACRFDQAAAGLFNLVLFTWALDNANFLLTPLSNYVVAKIMKKPFIKTEFAVAENMVKRLNFVGLLFISLPFCPLTWMFTPFFLGVGFKWEKNIIKYFYSKPKRQWNGQRAGLFYTVFLSLTFVALGMVISGYFFTSKTFVKDCSIDSSIDDCVHACGPFIYAESNLDPFQQIISRYTILTIFWQACFKYPYLPWFTIIMLSLLLAIKQNTLLIDRFTSVGKEKMLEAQIFAIDMDRKKQEKKLRKLKAIEISMLEDEKDEGEKETSKFPQDSSQLVIGKEKTI